MNKMFCGKCKWWSGLLVVGECMWPESVVYGETTINSMQCTGYTSMQEDAEDNKPHVGPCHQHI